MRSFVSVFLLMVSSAVAADATRKMDVWPGGGIFTQVVDSSEWRTTFQITNGDTRTVYVGLIIFDDLGEMLRLPFSGSTAGSIGFTLEPNRTQVLSTDGTGALKQG